MAIKNIFCILAKTGSGKSTYMNGIMEDKEFVKENSISLLVYGTTRKRRHGEIENIDYYFHSKEEYEAIPSEEIIETRSYYTINDGEIFYFTKKEYLEDADNLLCITSPYQFRSYLGWIENENLRGTHHYNIYAIIIDAELKTRILRVVHNRATNDKDIYEMCRRVIQEKTEFDDVVKDVSLLSHPRKFSNVLEINNNSSWKSDLETNLNKIKQFIHRNIENSHK